MEMKVLWYGFHAWKSFNYIVVILIELIVLQNNELFFFVFCQFGFDNVPLGDDHVMHCTDAIIGEFVIDQPPVCEILQRSLFAKHAAVL